MQGNRAQPSDGIDTARHSAGIRTAGQILLLAAVYLVTAKLGFRLAVVHPSATTVWPPTGIALAALLLLGKSGPASRSAHSSRT